MIIVATCNSIDTFKNHDLLWCTFLLDILFPLQIIAHVGSRTQPNRYVAQQHTIQAGPAYMQPNSQNVSSGGILILTPLSCGFLPCYFTILQ